MLRLCKILWPAPDDVRMLNLTSAELLSWHMSKGAREVGYQRVS